MGLEEKIERTVRNLLDHPGKNRSQVLTRREVAIQKLHEELWLHIIKEWQKQQPDQFPIPELIKHESLRNTFGDAVFTGLGFSPDASHPLLAAVFERYGKLDKTKCSVYYEKSDRDSRFVMSDVFFTGKHAEENARILMNFMWKFYWSTSHPIPETLTGVKIKESIGLGVYRAVAVETTNYSELLRRTIKGYGILSPEKCLVYHETRQKGSREGMTAAFFFGENGRANIASLLQFEFEHYWQQRYGCAELVPYNEVIKPAVGVGVYSALKLKEDPEILMRIAFPDYGIMTPEKKALVDAKYSHMAYRQRCLVHQRFKLTS